MFSATGRDSGTGLCRRAGSCVRDYGPKGRDPAAVCRGSTPLQTVVSSATEPKPDPGASRGHALPGSSSLRENDSPQNPVPLARFPAEDESDPSAVWSTNDPVALTSGLRFMDTPSVPESEDGYE
jgi:hypothetical protein